MEDLRMHYGFYGNTDIEAYFIQLLQCQLTNLYLEKLLGTSRISVTSAYPFLNSFFHKFSLLYLQVGTLDIFVLLPPLTKP